jgi:hypothetical protein
MEKGRNKMKDMVSNSAFAAKFFSFINPLITQKTE